MLYLNPPFHVINGISLFSDHEDPLQYYYLPMAPKFTRIRDEATGQDVPQLQLIKYRGSAGDGGFLNFDVNIGVEQELLEETRDELQRLMDLRDKPRLGPVPLIGGTVKMMLFGRESGDTAEEPKFVLKINHHAKPALYGNNQAAFSVALDAPGVAILEKALQGEMAPIGIVYSLEYLALRPAYAVRVHVDWDRVQDHLDEEYGIDAVFVSAQISDTVDKLIEQKIIDIEVDTYVPEGEDTAEIISRKDQAVDEVKDMIFDSFFEPSLDPLQEEEEDGWDKATRMFERVTAIHLTGGASSLGTFSYRKTHYSRIDKKTLNFNMKERSAVKRSIYPQGHLSGLFRILRNDGIELERFIVPVDGDSPWFERRKVTAISRANFEEDSIQSINVRVRYGDEPQNVLLESSADKKPAEWLSIITNGKFVREVQYSYTVSFKNVDRTERPGKIESPKLITNEDKLGITPRDLYSVVQVPIVALKGFPWDQYSHVEVKVKYGDEQNAIQLEDTFLLDKDKKETVWKMFVLDPEKTTFSYKLIYRAADHNDKEMPTVFSDNESIIIRDPYPRKRVLQVVPSFDWNEVDRAFVDLKYKDDGNDLIHEESFEFTKDKSATENFKVSLVDSNVRLISYSVTILYNDGRMKEIPRSYTQDRRIFVRDDMLGHKMVLIRPENEPFEEKNIKNIKVELRYNDSDSGLDFADHLTFKKMTDQGYFEFDYADEAKTSFEYQVVYMFNNGLSITRDWETANEDQVIIPVG